MLRPKSYGLDYFYVVPGVAFTEHSTAQGTAHLRREWSPDWASNLRHDYMYYLMNY